MAHITAPKVKCGDCAKFTIKAPHDFFEMEEMGVCPKRPGKFLKSAALRYCIDYDPKAPVCKNFEWGNCYSMKAPEDRYGSPCPCNGIDCKHECPEFVLLEAR